MKRPLLVALLAAAALILHFAVPFVFVETAEDGTTTSETLWPSDVRSREGVPDPVPAASMAYAWTGLNIMVVGAILLWTVRWWGLDGGRGIAAHAGTAGATLLGAVITLHAHGLWVGRGVATLIQTGMGTDGPPAKYQSAAFSADHYSAVWPISPLLVGGLALAVAWFALGHLVAQSKERETAQQTGRHVRAGRMVLVAFAVLLVVPWSLQQLDDNLSQGAEETDQDLFVVSLYDALRIHQDTSVAADERGEPGLEEYTEVAAMGSVLAGLGVALVLGLAATAAAGALLVEEDDKVTGRTLQLIPTSIVGLAILGWGATIATMAILFANPNDRLSADPAWVPLAALVPLVYGVIAVVASLRTLSVDADRLVVDDFPEPVVFD